MLLITRNASLFDRETKKKDDNDMNNNSKWRYPEKECRLGIDERQRMKTKASSSVLLDHLGKSLERGENKNRVEWKRADDKNEQ